MKKILIIIISSFLSLGWFLGEKKITLQCQDDISGLNTKLELEISKNRDELTFISYSEEYLQKYDVKYKRVSKDYFPEHYEWEKDENIMRFYAEHQEFGWSYGNRFYLDIMVMNDLSGIVSNYIGLQFNCDNEEYIDSKKSIFDSLFPKEYENLTEMKEELERIGNITIGFKDYTYEGCGMFGCLESAEFYDYDDFSETFVFRFDKNQKIAEHAIQFFERMCRPRIDVGSTVFCVRFPGSGDKGPKTIKLIESLN